MAETTITLTDAEIEALTDFIELNLIDVIRTDTEIDNIHWLCCMCEVYKKLKDE